MCPQLLGLCCGVEDLELVFTMQPQIANGFVQNWKKTPN